MNGLSYFSPNYPVHITPLVSVVLIARRVYDCEKCLDTLMKQSTTFETSLREWNMILAVTLSSVIRERYGVQLDATDFGEAETISDLYRCVLSKKRQMLVPAFVI